MRRVYQVLILSIVTLTLVGCSSTQQPTKQVSLSANETAGTTQSTAAQAGYQNLLSVVGNTRAAVSAGDFAKAQTEFSKFENNWKQVEDGVKAKSSDNYKGIEDSLERITGELRGSQPNKETVLADLQSMERTINSAAKL